MGYFPIASKMHFINSIPTLTSSHDVIVFTSSSSVTLCSSEVQLSVSLSSSEVSSSSWKIVEKSRFRKVMNPENLHMQVWFDKWLISVVKDKMSPCEYAQTRSVCRLQNIRDTKPCLVWKYFSRESLTSKGLMVNFLKPTFNLGISLIVPTSSRPIWQSSNFECG